MNEWKSVRTSITVFVILACIFMVAASLYAFKSIGFVGSAPVTNTISVSGHGESFAVPNIATVGFSVEKTASTVADAQAQVTKITNDVLATLKGLGIAEKDIQTTSYDVYPKYEYSSVTCSVNVVCPSSKQILTGYTVSNSISVKIRAIDSAGNVLGALGKKNVTNISGLTLSVEDDTAVKAEARNKAITLAKTQAETLAKQLGVRLVRITSFSESGNAQPIYYSKNSMLGMGAADVQSAAPSIPVGQNKASSDVMITYEIQ